MRNHSSYFAFAVMLVLSLTSRPAASQQPGEMEIRRGVIEQITEIPLPSNHHRGVGADRRLPGRLGIGSLIGGGTGRDVAMVPGALGGGPARQQRSKTLRSTDTWTVIIVRVTSEVLVQVTQAIDPGLRPGPRVYIEGSGEGGRVIAQQ